MPLTWQVLLVQLVPKYPQHSHHAPGYPASNQNRLCEACSGFKKRRSIISLPGKVTACNQINDHDPDWIPPNNLYPICAIVVKADPNTPSLHPLLPRTNTYWTATREMHCPFNCAHTSQWTFKDLRRQWKYHSISHLYILQYEKNCKPLHITSNWLKVCAYKCTTARYCAEHYHSYRSQPDY